MQARLPADHFRAVTPKREMWPPKRARIVPQKKATGPTPLGCICDKDFFVLLLVFTPKFEGKIHTKEGFCFPKRECVPQKKATGLIPLRCICGKDLFVVLFSVFTPECESKIRTKGGFCAPQRECVPQAKIVPQKKAIEPMPLVCIFEEDFCFFFLVFPANVRAKSVPKEIFVPPKREYVSQAKIVPQKKATGPMRLRCICEKELLLVFISELKFFLLQNFLCPPPPQHITLAPGLHP